MKMFEKYLLHVSLNGPRFKDKDMQQFKVLQRRAPAKARGAVAGHGDRSLEEPCLEKWQATDAVATSWELSIRARVKCKCLSSYPLVWVCRAWRCGSIICSIMFAISGRKGLSGATRQGS